MFIGVWLTVVGGQIVITQLGSKAMKVHIGGLDGPQWIISVLVSFTVLIVNVVLKCFPDTCCPVLGDETQKDIEAAALDYATLRGIASMNRGK